jgi:hypothetical protein
LVQPDCARVVSPRVLPDSSPQLASEWNRPGSNSAESEDRLWGGFAFSDRDTQMPLSWQPGLLSPTADSDAIRLIVIPDERIGLSVARALVTMVGAEVAHLERYGKERQWLPKFIGWAAAQVRRRAGFRCTCSTASPYVCTYQHSHAPTRLICLLG